MIVIVTGANGFLGSYVCETLKTEHQLIKWANTNSSAETFKCDITKADEALAILRSTITDGSDVGIIHLAAKGRVTDTLQNLHLVNVGGTFNLLSSIRTILSEHPTMTCFFIYASSTLIYDLETDELPRTFYALTKIHAENYCRFFARNNNRLKVSILRISNIYDEDLKHKNVLSIFINNFVKNEDCLITGDGSSVRDFIEVKDVARVVHDLINKRKELEQITSFDVCTGHAISILKLAEEIGFKPNQIKCKKPETEKEEEDSTLPYTPNQIGQAVGWVPRKVDIQNLLRRKITTKDDGGAPR